ncbi:hypothetical protein ACHAWT_002161, partial [Skeletonema menzelii]
MKIIAFSISTILVALTSASAVTVQVQRLRGYKETHERELQEECPGSTSTPQCSATAGGRGSAYMPNSGCYIEMFEAGKTYKTVAAHATLDWDCSTEELCILVEAVPGETYFVDGTDNDVWVKDYTSSGNGKLTAIGGGFEIISGVSSNFTAWKACYEVEAKCYTEIEIHTNFRNVNDVNEEARTASTGKTGKGKNDNSEGQGFIALDLTCTTTTTVATVATTASSPGVTVGTPVTTTTTTTATQSGSVP